MTTITAKSADNVEFPSVFNQTPTVPPKGWFGTIGDLITQGLDVYKTVATEKYKSKQPLMTTVQPIVLQSAGTYPTSTIAPAMGSQGILPNNALFIPTGSNTPQPLAVNTDYSKYLWIAIAVLAGVLLINRLR